MNALTNTTLFVISDDLNSGEALAASLRDHLDVDAHPLTPGPECMHALETPPQAVVLQEAEPRKSTLQLVRTLNQQKVPTVVLSQFGQLSRAVRTIRFGACDYIVQEGAYLEKLSASLDQVFTYRTAQSNITQIKHTARKDLKRVVLVSAMLVVGLLVSLVVG